MTDMSGIVLGILVYIFRPVDFQRLNIFLTFLISFTPSITPSNTAMPVLNARMIAVPLSAAGAIGANRFRAVSAIICCWARNSSNASAFCC